MATALRGARLPVARSQTGAELHEVRVEATARAPRAQLLQLKALDRHSRTSSSRRFCGALVCAIAPAQLRRRQLYRRIRHVQRQATGKASAELLESYDTAKFEEYFSRRPVEVLSRCSRILWRGGGWVQTYTAHRADASQAPELARQLREVLTDLGPSFVKLGQVLSSRVDLLPKEYVAELKSLTDRVEPFPTAEARRILQEEWGEAGGEVSALDLPESPVAAASLGQVYRVESSTGQVLAVKVQRPGIREQICLDLLLMRTLAPSMKERLGLNTDLAAFVDEYGSRFIAELDYELEVSNALRFRDAATQIGLTSVCVPSPVVSLSSKCILVTEWVDGERIDKDRNPEAARLCGVAMTAYLLMLLETGQLHADPHPGNLFRTSDGRLCILDWGLTTSVTAAQREAIISYFVHILAEDYASIPLDLVNLGFIADRAKGAVADDVAAKAIAAIFQALASGGAVTKRVSDVMTDIQAVRGRYGNIGQLPAYFAYILRAFSILEGIGLEQDPQYSIVADCYPYIVSRLFREEGKRAKEVLQALLYSHVPAPGENPPPLKASRVLRLLRAVETYAEQAAADAPQPSDDRERRRRGANPEEKILQRFLESAALQEVVAFEVARIIDVLTREALELLATPAIVLGIVPRRSAQDEAVLRSIVELAEGLLGQPIARTDLQEVANRLLTAGPRAFRTLLRQLSRAPTSSTSGFAMRLIAALIRQASTRLR